jgi:hypothetical protein
MVRARSKITGAVRAGSVGSDGSGMSKRADNEGLSLGYRIGYRIRYSLLHVFGPAQQAGSADPHRRLERERAAKVDAARRARLAREAGQG